MFLKVSLLLDALPGNYFAKKPKEILDSNLNINLLKDELVRIEYGIIVWYQSWCYLTADQQINQIPFFSITITFDNNQYPA